MEVFDEAAAFEPELDSGLDLELDDDYVPLDVKKDIEAEFGVLNGVAKGRQEVSRPGVNDHLRKAHNTQKRAGTPKADVNTAWSDQASCKDHPEPDIFFARPW